VRGVCIQLRNPFWVYTLAGVTSSRMGDHPGTLVTNHCHTYTHVLKNLQYPPPQYPKLMTSVVEAWTKKKFQYLLFYFIIIHINKLSVTVRLDLYLTTLKAAIKKIKTAVYYYAIMIICYSILYNIIMLRDTYLF